MGTRKISRAFRVDGVLTDVTSAKLSDPTGAYGVKRDDTGAVVVADGTDMVHESTGTYSYTFTEPADGLSYTGYVEFVYGGNTYHFEHDIPAITVSSDSLSVSYASLRRHLGRYLGYGTDPTSWTSDQILDVDDCLDIGLRSFYWPVTPEGELAHNWSFLRASTSISLTSGDFDYDLPANYAAMIEDPYVVGDQKGRIDRIDPETLLAMQARRAASGNPLYCAVRAKSFSAASGTIYELLLYPTPSASDTLVVPYSFEPTAIGTSEYPPGGSVHGEAILEACLAAAELTIGRVEAQHTRRFHERLAASIRMDKEQRA